MLFRERNYSLDRYPKCLFPISTRLMKAAKGSSALFVLLYCALFSALYLAVLLANCAGPTQHMHKAVFAATSIDKIAISDFLPIDPCPDAAQQNRAPVRHTEPIPCSSLHCESLGYAEAPGAEDCYAYTKAAETPT